MARSASRGHLRDMFQRLALAVSHVLLMTFLGGCAGPELVVGELDPDTETLILAQAWIGEFLGAAEGEVLGEPFQNPAAGLTIAFDADSLGRTDCFFCVTVTLDTVFVRTNVTVGDPVRLDLRYTTDGVERTLVLDRFSGAGGTANVLQGRAIIRPVDTSGPPTLDLRYLLQR